MGNCQTGRGLFVRRLTGVLALLWLPLAAWAATDMAVSIGARAFHYAELDDSNHVIDKETGVLPWLGVESGWQFHPQWRLAGDWQGAFGDVAYDGATWLGTPHRTRTRVYENRFDLTLGWQAGERQTRLQTLLGYYQRDRDVQPRNGVQGLHETYRWGRLGVGMEQPLSEKLQVSLQVVWALAARLGINLAATPDIPLPMAPQYQLGLVWRFDCRQGVCPRLLGQFRRMDSHASRYVWSGGAAVSLHEPASTLNEFDLGVQLVF